MLSENVILEKVFSYNRRSELLVPYQKSRFLVSFSNSIRRVVSNQNPPSEMSKEFRNFLPH